MEIGPILRELRESKGLSIVNLAEQVDVSSSHISQIERNLSSPSITMLKKLSNVLEVPITYFFKGEDKKNGYVIKKSERKKLIVPNSNLIYELLSPTMESDFQLLLTRIDIGGQLGDSQIGHAGAECCYIAKGTVEFTVEDEVYLLTEGDSIYYPEDTPHNVINKGETEAVIISVISPADF